MTTLPALTIVTINDQPIGDTFGFNLQFPYNISNYRITLTAKQSKKQSDTAADLRISVTAGTITPDANGMYNITLASLPGQTSGLHETTYFFDVATVDTNGNVTHLIHPDSTITFIQPDTENP